MLETEGQQDSRCGSTGGMTNPYPYDPKKTVLSVEEDTSGFYLTIGRSLINGIASLFRKETTINASSDNQAKAIKDEGK